MAKLNPCLHLFLLTLCLVHTIRSDAGKYSKRANEDSPFRIQKLNFIWSKAVRQLERPELKRLQVEFEELDMAYLGAKESHAVGKDREKQQLIELDKRLRVFLRQLKIENILDSLEKKAKWNDDHAHHEVNNDVKIDDIFADQRLTELWMTAKKAGFSKEELKALREEFYHHERKILDYNDRAKDYNKIAVENSLHEEVDEDADARSIEETKRLKEAFRDIEHGYNRFAEKISNASTTGDFTFSNPRVKELWQQALNKKTFSKEELESIKTELKHFETRLEKLNFLEKEVSLSKESRQAAGKSADSGHHQEVTDRFSDMVRKVKKHEDFILTKISHSEL